MILYCLGPVGSGKSTLLQELSSKTKSDGAETMPDQPQPTVGMNHFNIPTKTPSKVAAEKEERQSLFRRCMRRNKTEPDEDLPVKELGGALSQNWVSYLQAALDSETEQMHLIFMISAPDISQAAQVSLSLISCLETIVAEKKALPSRVLLVYSKADFFDNDIQTMIALKQLRNILQVEKLFLWYAGSVEFCEVIYSHHSGKGITEIKDWIHRLRNATDLTGESP